MTAPLDDFRALLARMPALDEGAARRVRSNFARSSNGSLGRLEEIAAWLAASTGRLPAVSRPLVAVFAASHGVAWDDTQGPTIKDTQRLVERAAQGAAAVNQVCLSHDLGLKFYDLALDLPTQDFRQGAALDERSAAATVAFGMEAVAGGIDVIALAGIGAGSPMAAAAVLAALSGGQGADWLADDDSGAAVIDGGLATHAGHLDDPLEVLRRLGGREFLAIAGAIVAARTEKAAVVLDGLAALATAAALARINPRAVDHCLLAHRSAAGKGEPFEILPLKPLLDLDIVEGQGVGAALAVGLLKTAAQLHAGLAAASRS
jgi:nicotinate-nucleotide--dimethylbenzimidazole phosphoribosyltransferase